MEFTSVLIRIQEVLLGISLTIQSAELFFAGDGLGFTPSFSRFPSWIRPVLRWGSTPSIFRFLHGVRGLGGLALIFMPSEIGTLGILMALQFLLPFRHRGAYNGGSDFMTTQVLAGVFLMRASGTHPGVVRAILCYLGIQTALSYFLSGLIKFRHAAWRNGDALRGFLMSNRYGTPVWLLETLQFPTLTRLMAHGILSFEILFPLSLTGPWLAWVFMFCGLGFHVLVFQVYGLNRFFWAWLSAYPALYYLSLQRWIAP